MNLEADFVGWAQKEDYEAAEAVFESMG